MDYLFPTILVLWVFVLSVWQRRSDAKWSLFVKEMEETVAWPRVRQSRANRPIEDSGPARAPTHR